MLVGVIHGGIIFDRGASILGPAGLLRFNMGMLGFLVYTSTGLTNFLQLSKGLDGQPDFTYKPVNNQDFQR